MDIKIVEIVKTWFNKADNWQKDLFINLWKGKDLDEVKKRATKLAYKEYNIEPCNLVSETVFPADIDNDADATTLTSLVSISNVQGVGALTPTNPLEFTNGLNVVYGGNGCGKSSYVKVLKKAENPKDKTQIFSNVFKETKIQPKATLVFSEDGNQKTIEWNLSNKEICPIRIYDTEVAKRFVNDSTETIYEPKLLNVFTKMVEVFDNIATKIKKDIEDKRNQLVSLPSEIQTSELAITFSKISSVKDLERFEKDADYSAEDEKELSLIEKSFSDNNPNLTKNKLQKQIEIITEICNQLNSAFVGLDDSNVAVFLSARNSQIENREKYEAFIKETRGISLINGFGSEKWRTMWKSSIEFKESFDTIPSDICVLCQQKLSKETNDRLQKFQSVYTSELEKSQQDAQNTYNEKIQLLQKLISNNLNKADIVERLTTNSFDENTIKYIESIVESLFIRASWLYDYENHMTEPRPSIPNQADFIKKFNEFVKANEYEIKSLNEFINNFETQSKKRQELKTKKWFSENSNNLNLLRSILNLKKIQREFKTNTLTKTKNQLSEKLITEVYINRFNEALKELNPSGSIKVELVSDGKKGKTTHRVSIKGAKENKKAEEILSEGEDRVVSIAAFMADLNSINKTQAFVFDDPITSLDHNYENNVAKLLVKLSFDRQVIVFTHRLAFAETLKTCEDNEQTENEYRSLNYIELLSSPLGEPLKRGEYGKTNFKSILGELRDKDLPNVKTLKDMGEYDLANDKLQSICAQLRKSLEIGVEKVLLDGLVTRYNKNISMLKLKSIRKIEDEDIRIFENMMTKYSYQEHSQPSEKPIPLPTTDDVYKDICALIEWNKKFNKK